ncbi:MAG: hypothetical protein ACSLEL_02355 [Candidatus Malihini olakiniferum]
MITLAWSQASESVIGAGSSQALNANRHCYLTAMSIIAYLYRDRGLHLRG